MTEREEGRGEKAQCAAGFTNEKRTGLCRLKPNDVFQKAAGSAIFGDLEEADRGLC